MRVRASAQAGGGGGEVVTEFASISSTSTTKSISGIVPGKKYTIIILASWSNATYYSTMTNISAVVSGMSNLQEIQAPAYFTGGSSTYGYYSAYTFDATDTEISFTLSRMEAKVAVLIHEE